VTVTHDAQHATRHTHAAERAVSRTIAMALESLYRTFMRRNSVYVGFIIAGAFVGEKVLNGTIDAMWESSNKGKLFKHLEASLAEDE
jgi:ubiquinol-cytochrome c reductase subunit 9